MTLLFFLLLLVCIFGLFRPFGNLERRVFAYGAAASFLMMGATAPPSKDSAKANAESVQANAVSFADAQALEKKNAVKIAQLKKQVAKVPVSDADENLRIYAELVELAPTNSEYANKKAEWGAKVLARERYEKHPEEALKIADWDWSAGGFGSIMIIDRLKLKNDAPFAIKDFVVKCVHSGPSGTEIDSNTRRIYEIVPASGTKTIRDLNMGFIHSQAASSRCEITDAVAI